MTKNPEKRKEKKTRRRDQPGPGFTYRQAWTLTVILGTVLALDFSAAAHGGQPLWIILASPPILWACWAWMKWQNRNRD